MDNETLLLVMLHICEHSDDPEAAFQALAEEYGENPTPPQDYSN